MQEDNTKAEKTNRIEFSEEHVPTLDEAAVLILEEVLHTKKANENLVKVCTCMVMAAVAQLKESREQMVKATIRAHEIANQAGIKIIT